jgi:hypothetical protein
MSRPVGSLDRTLEGLTIGFHKHVEHSKRQRSFTAPHEVEQQVRVEVAGEAGNAWGFVDKIVNFKLPFFYAPGERDPPFATPHFSYGFEHGVQTQELIVAQASVVEWIKNKSSWIVGAKVRFAVVAPNLTGETAIPYSLTAHLTFEGWAAESEMGEMS